MIPKIIHYCWFGGNPLPTDAQKCIASWKKFLPDYEIKEWNESNFDVHCCPYVSEAYDQKKYAFVSDYARFYVLYHEGGLYFDTDVEVIRDMGHIIEAGNFMGFEKSMATQDPSSSALGVSPGLGLGVSPGLGLGVAPGLGLGVAPSLDLVKEMLAQYESRPHFSIGDGTVVTATTTLLKRYGLRDENVTQQVADVTVYPSDYFCPMDYVTGKTTITDNTVSIHHYSCSWKPKSHRIKRRIIQLIGDRATKCLVKIKHLL